MLPIIFWYGFEEFCTFKSVVTLKHKSRFAIASLYIIGTEGIMILSMPRFIAL